ncbi:hypothetical protein EV659_10345 [Rhodothalassium salexigens DSM 2132]|uniref:Uncharacterized protein n=1 Tax=Rhodothalassium salexigens DSM 2132 TaxID=1188247 RepID=A0A4R2PN22_RHOSA|nr:hypothetical protein [Rhodothalassium salexigens]MBB4211186.1 hypothetical protein [Rhodothalassium salexigens DSM 2132]TCP36158.1 hypothetical protein EV659_10345 [Rhodothalassium salexigens DSM 2132]
MLTIEDCIALSTLTEAEIDAIAEHEHLPEIAAVELGAYLMQTRDGKARVKAMIVDDIHAAQAREQHAHAAKLKLCLKHFLAEHGPELGRQVSADARADTTPDPRANHRADRAGATD